MFRSRGGLKGSGTTDGVTMNATDRGATGPARLVRTCAYACIASSISVSGVSPASCASASNTSQSTSLHSKVRSLLASDEGGWRLVGATSTDSSLGP